MGLLPLLATSFEASLSRLGDYHPWSERIIHLLLSQWPRAWSPLERVSSPLFPWPVCLCPCMRRWSTHSSCPFTPQVCHCHFGMRAKGLQALNWVGKCLQNPDKPPQFLLPILLPSSSSFLPFSFLPSPPSSPFRPSLIPSLIASYCIYSAHGFFKKGRHAW